MATGQDRIWGGVPIRNRHFTGRESLLERLEEALGGTSKVSVLPHTLQGLGGVGKTQLAVEYVYRQVDRYDLVWWIAAEQPSGVLRSLTELAERLGLPTTEDSERNARVVLDSLAGGGLTWLLVYDNAGDPETLDQFVPSSGGDVIVTSRTREWAAVGPSIEVDVFERAESVEYLQRRGAGETKIPASEADALAEKLGDLPLALEQAAAWHLSTAMPVQEYIALLDTHATDLLAEGKPSHYPFSVAAFVILAMERLRNDEPATAEFFELFAFLGGEPVPVSLLVNGRHAELSEPLSGLLRDRVRCGRAIRGLVRFGLAKVDAAQRIQVHRLVQRVLRDEMSSDRAAAALRNVRAILVGASPGNPDEYADLERHAALGPHLDPADLTNADILDGRVVVLDHARYLFIVGDYENSRHLAERAARTWERETSDSRLGPDGELTLLARAHLANALRALGDSASAAALARDTYRRFRDSSLIGPDHEFTLITGNQIGADLRIAGRYPEALEFAQASVAAHRTVFGADGTYPLRAKLGLAASLRLVGDFRGAAGLDEEVVESAGDGRQSLEARMNLALDYYGQGEYAAGLQLVEAWREPLRHVVGSHHRLALLADRTYGILLRKAGRLAESVELLQEAHARTLARFGPDHEHAVAVAVSLANAFRQVGQVDVAEDLISEALRRYGSTFGATHPLTLAATVNAAIVKRAVGQLDHATALDERAYEKLAEVLSPDHPYTLCAGGSVAADHALAGDHRSALARSTSILETSAHPDALLRAINRSHDLRATGSVQEGEALFARSLEGLRASLGHEHPEVVAVADGRRAEVDLEPMPS
ncbi:Tetratricopeptide repeat-containing protein [Asanoa hainanensis]|uniref:Tetratricopeptide repeat-containing protein n=1 Tax=Asanoa hainanensis TaxID=560556 RepID=A0A239PG05_9ACTN|nr:FxSxx-COOH system tetratricopeptide repeat protein [Asanoa hainanensis]SNT65920.1 Tetratricopeptide repeat-containing protein [Asanoa hainanensis]